MSEHYGWADLPEGLLHSVVALSGSFSDLFAFALTCRSWRAAFSSYPSKATFSTLFPPLLLQPDVPMRTPCDLPFVHKHPCRVTDLASSQHLRLRCQIPLGSFCFTGASYGQLIFSSNRSCLLVDVFTGVTVSPPLLPDDNRSKLYYGALTAPLASPNSLLLVSTSSGSFFWRVGSHYWHPFLCNETIKQIVAFKGRLFGTDSGGRLFTLHLAPQIHIQTVVWGESTSTGKRLVNVCLVPCGDMLILIRSRGSFPARGDTFEAFRLDLSTEHAKFVKVEELGNWAIFIGTDERSQPLSLMNPERWGGKSNCIYCYSHDSERWTAFELGKPASDPNIFVFISWASIVQPMWVVPSMFSLCP